MKWLLFALTSSALFGQADRPSPGSLFRLSGELADASRDLRAAGVGDIITVLVSDRASAVAQGTSNTSRKSAAKNSIQALAGTLAAGNPLANLANTSNDQQLQGQGQTSRDITVSTSLSATVVAVTPGGSLVIEGAKDIGINSEKQSITLRGMVRPADLTPANTIRSDQVASLAIQVNGKGVVGDAIKRPFFLYRLLAGLLPF